MKFVKEMEGVEPFGGSRYKVAVQRTAQCKGSTVYICIYVCTGNMNVHVPISTLGIEFGFWMPSFVFSIGITLLKET